MRDGVRKIQKEWQMNGQMDGEINKQNIQMLTPFKHRAVTPFKTGLKCSPIPNCKKFPNFVLKNSWLHLIHFQLKRYFYYKDFPSSKRCAIFPLNPPNVDSFPNVEGPWTLSQREVWQPWIKLLHLKIMKSNREALLNVTKVVLIFINP